MKPAYKRKRITRLISSFLIALVILGVYHSVAAEPSNIKSAANYQFRKGPYLIYNGHNAQMKVLWQLNEAAECTINWGSDTSYSSGSTKTKEYGNDHQHAYTIKNLKPGIKYYYNVFVKDTYHTGSFYSAPKPSSKNVSFIVYGDTRSFPAIHNAIAGSIVSTYTADPAFQTFVLLTGDLVTYGADESSWDNEFFGPTNINIRQILKNLPFLTSVGSHEKSKKRGSSYVKTNFNLFKKYFPYPFAWGTCWSFDYGPAHFVIVDQYLKYSNLIRLAWIKKDLAASDKKWKFVCLHIPGWAAGDASAHSNNKEVRKSIQPLLEKYRVTALFAGHNHFYSRALVNGVYHITTGGGGAPLSHGVDPHLPNIIAAKRTHHYCKVIIDDNVMTFTAIEPNGSIIDSFSVGANH